MSKSQRAISNLIINPQFQWRYVAWLLLSGLALVAILNSVFYHFVSENYQILVDLSPMTDDAKALMYKELNQLVLILSLMSVLFLALIVVLGLVFSHRAAGPIYQLNQVINRIKDGDLSARVNLRPNDEFKDVAKDFNEMIDKISPKKT